MWLGGNRDLEQSSVQETKAKQKVQNNEKAHVVLDSVLPLSTRCSQKTTFPQLLVHMHRYFRRR